MIRDVRNACVHVLLVSALPACSKRIPADLDSAHGWVLIEAEEPVQAKSLAGLVVDPSGAPLPDVVVERMTTKWKKRVEATLTSSKGKFRLGDGGAGTYYLKLRHMGFDDLEVVVVLAPESSKSLRIEMQIAN